MTHVADGDVLLDRDGVLIAERSGYVLAPDHIELLPGAADAVRRLTIADRRVFVVTNQSPVGRGLITQRELDAIHTRLSALIAEQGGRIGGYFVCTHVAADACACRKPQPGLLHLARDVAGVDLARATLVGDQISDAEAAQRAGCNAILLSCGDARWLTQLPGVTFAADLSDAVDLILGAVRA